MKIESIFMSKERVIALICFNSIYISLDFEWTWTNLHDKSGQSSSEEGSIVMDKWIH